MKHIRVATVEDREAVVNLRAAEYARSSEFALIDPGIVGWANDESGVVLVASDAGRLVTTMRGSVALDVQQAEDLLECQARISQVVFPALILTRAATASTHRNVGLNTALRYHFFAAAVGRIESVLGAVYSGAPRVGTMTDVGYEFFPTSWKDGISTSWKEGVRPYSERCLAVLTGSRLKQAISRLKSSAEPALSQYPWIGSAIEWQSSR